MAYAYPKCKNIHVDDHSKPYKDEVVRYLDLIGTTDVGQTLYKFIAQTTKSVQITWTVGRSYLLTGATDINKSDEDRIIKSSMRIEKERGLSVDDSVTAAMNEDPIVKSKLVDKYAKGHPVMQQFTFSILAALGVQSTFMLPTKDIGTGLGIDVELEYHPAAYRQIIKNTGRLSPGFGPGEVLYHELVHSLRMMAGLVLDGSVPQRWDMDSFEEFCSIVSANMYKSARGFTTLSFDHRLSGKTPWNGLTPLPGALADPKRYFEEFKPQFVKWFSNQRDFCVGLAGSCAHFNPMAVAAGAFRIAVAKC